MGGYTILALDTCLRPCSVALASNNELLAYRFESNVNMQVEKLALMIDEVISDVGSLDYIAVCVGPGSFTGIRIGIACAQGISAIKKIPIIPVSTLDVAAYEISKTEKSSFTVVMDAGKHKYYAKHFLKPEIQPKINRTDSEKNLLGGHSQIILDARENSNMSEDSSTKTMKQSEIKFQKGSNDVIVLSNEDLSKNIGNIYSIVSLSDDTNVHSKNNSKGNSKDIIFNAKLMLEYASINIECATFYPEPIYV